VVVVAGALAAGACGGTEWNAGKQPKPLSAAQARAAAAAQKKAEVPYVNALVAKYQTNHVLNSLDDNRCLASAVVHGFGVAGISAHGLTANGLRNPRTTLDDLPTPTLAQADAIGAGVQRCHIAPAAAGMARSFGATDAQSAACMTSAFGRPQARRFLALLVLGRQRISLAVAHSVVGLISSCLDLAALIVRAASLPPDATIRQCISSALHGADAELKDYLALMIAGGDREQIQQAQGALLVAMNQCRPGAQTGFTVPPS